MPPRALPAELQDAILCEYAVGRGHQVNFDADLARAGARVCRVYRYNIRAEALIHHLVHSGLPGCAWPVLRLRAGRYACANQTSTYELLDRICRTFQPMNIDDLHALHRAARDQPDVYGAFAGLNHWSPSFTIEQLRRLAHRVVRSP